MKQRGRKSAASLAVPRIAGPVDRIERPDAPYNLSDLAAAEWRAIVNRLPADYFPRETWPMLAQLCRHIVASDRLGMLITALEGPDGGWEVEHWLKLLAAQERESRAISSLCGRMRLSHVAVLRQDRTERPADDKAKPWEWR
jgi:hypothetical protein